MTKKQILCIVEGEVSEIEILNKLNHEFIHREIEFLPLCTNIYHFYHAYMKEKEEIGDDIDMFIFLKTKYDKSELLKDKNHRDFLGIYLFLDFDRHEPLANLQKCVNCIPDMLRLFDNHNENGKLYISYPMVEAFQHPIDSCNICETQIKLGKKYKKHVEDICYLLSTNTLDQTLISHLKQSNLLIYGNFEFPDEYKIDEWSQLSIYENQLKKYISYDKVLVLSPFVLFLLEYIGKNLFLKWKSSVN